MPNHDPAAEAAVVRSDALPAPRPTPPRDPDAQRWEASWAHRYPLAVVALLALLAYSDSFTGAFVFDDLQHVRDNLRIRDLGALLSWSGYLAVRHRFVGYLTFALNYAVGGLSVGEYHAVNLAIHLVNAGLVYALVVLAFRTPRVRGSALAPSAQAVAFFAAALFATHPLQTQAVTYVVQRFTSLAALFYLLAVVLFVRWRLLRQGGGAWRVEGAALYVAVLASALVAMKTKEIAATLPAAIVLAELCLFEPAPWRRRVFLLPIAATALVVPLAYASSAPLTAAAVAQATRVQTGLSRLDYLLTQPPVILTYLRLLLWPARQNVDYDFPLAHRLFEPRVIGSILVLLALVAAAVVLYFRTVPTQRDRRVDPSLRLVAFGIGWFFVTLAVESSVIPIADVINEHRVYLPSIGAFAAGGVLLALALVRLHRGRAARDLVLAAVLLSVVLGIATFRRNRVWADEITLWSDAAAKSPAKSRPHMNLGSALASAGRLEESVRELRRALELEPGSAYTHAQLGAALLALGRLGDAEPELREAVRLEPKDPEALFNLGAVMLRAGRPEEARPVLRRFLEVAPSTYAAARRIAERALR